MSSDRRPCRDEDLARLLQFEEQQQLIHDFDTERYAQPNLTNLELTRQCAQINLFDEKCSSFLAPSYGFGSRREQNSNQQIPVTNHSVGYPENFRLPPLPSIDQFYASDTVVRKIPRDSRRNQKDGVEQQYCRNPARPSRTVSKNSTQDPFDYSSSNGILERNLQSPHVDRRNSRSHSPVMSVKGVSSRRIFSSSDISTGGETPLISRSTDHNGTLRPQRQGGSSSRDRRYSVDNAVAIGPNGRDRLYRTQVTSQTEDDDLELARRMQEIEDRGMGRLNSGREFEIDVHQIDDSDIQGLTTRRKISNDFEALAKLLSESGTNMSELSDEVLNELLGSSTGKHMKPSKTPNTSKIKSTLSNSSHETKTEREYDANKPSISKFHYPSGLAIKSAPVSPLNSVVMASDKVASVMPEFIVSEQSKQTTESMHVDNPLKNKPKRRGLFGFQVMNRSRLDLGEALKDPPTTVCPSGSVPSAVDLVDDRLSVVPGFGGVPAAIPPPPGGSLSIQPSQRQSRSMSPPRVPLRTASGIPGGIPPKPAGMVGISGNSCRGMYRGTNICSICGLSHGTFLKVFNRKYHPECFRCSSCNGKIDPNDQFKYTTDEHGRMHPHHRECFLCFGVQCCVCQQKIPVTPDGRVPFIKHPFFDTELMCVRHADEPHRRCSGCQRLEPYDAPFIDLMDGDRCVCASCCRSVVVDSSDAKPLWKSVLSFLEQNLKVPIWGPMRDIPILIVGSESLSEQVRAQGRIHVTNSQLLMTSGLCLTDHGHQSNMSSFHTNSAYSKSSKQSSDDVIAIVCLTGLPRALTAAILAHEVVHAWIKFHPNYDSRKPLPAQVEEGLCQLVATLYLSDGIIPNSDKNMVDGSSEKKLRQYYKFSIERDQSEIYGIGYRRAAIAYSEIGMEGLLSHVLEYRDFPNTSENA
jgi:Protein DA1/LIM domain